MPPKREPRAPSRPKARLAYTRPYNAASPATCRAFMRLWQEGVRIADIANSINISESIGYEWQANLRDHGSIRPESQAPAGRRYCLTVADEKAILDKLQKSCWMYLDELAEWLRLERDVDVSISTVSRLLKRNNWTRKTLQIGSNQQNSVLRQDYFLEMRNYAADQLIFIDESIFNEKTGWRRRGRAPIGRPATVRGNINRGDTWSLLPAYTIDGYLPCTGIRKGYFDREAFLQWIQYQLLPAIAEKYDGKTMVIVLDNVSIHTTAVLTKLVQDADHIIKFLPPYSPDYNPIELTFAVLKQWMKRNYFHERGQYRSYGEYLAMAVVESECDRFAHNHFRHAAKGCYLMRDEWEALQERNRLTDLGLIEGDGLEELYNSSDVETALLDGGNVEETLSSDDSIEN